MVSAVKSRPNHYETLGLQPTAGSAEITHAFAREISAARPRAIGGLAAVSIAYETLRDPVRRRAYDVSLGIKSLPQLTPSVTARMGRPSFLAAPPADDPLKAPAAPEPAVQADREPA